MLPTVGYFVRSYWARGVVATFYCDLAKVPEG
jgi:hypothetical protein